MTEPDKFQKTNFSKTSLLRCLFLSMMSAALFCALPFVPPLGMTAFLFSPTPLALLGARENKTWMVWGLLGATLLLSLVNFQFALYFLLSDGLLCLGLTLPLGKLKSGGESLLFCTVASIVSKIVWVALLISLTGHNPFAIDPNKLRTILTETYSWMVIQGEREAEFFRESMEQAVMLTPYMVPSLVILYSMLDSFLNYRLCETLQRPYKTKFPALPSFKEWRFPKSLLWALIFAFALPFFTEKETWRLWIMLGVNLKLLVLMFFFLQGVSLVWWSLARLTINFLLRVLVVALLLLPGLNMGVIAIGVGDACLNFRARKIKQT